MPKEKDQASTQEGSNSAIFSKNMKYFVNTYSSANIPPVITLNDNKGKVLTTLVDNQKLKQQMSGLNMPSKEFFTFKTTDGVELNGWIMKPAIRYQQEISCHPAPIQRSRLSASS